MCVNDFRDCSDTTKLKSEIIKVSVILKIIRKKSFTEKVQLKTNNNNNNNCTHKLQLHPSICKSGVHLF